MSGNRREFVRRMIAFSALAATGVIALFELLVRQPGPESQQIVSTLSVSTTATQRSSSGVNTAQTSTTAIPSGYVFVASISALNGQSSAYFNHPSFGTSILLNLNGTWKAFSALCTHAGCTVQYTGSSIYCPCHTAYFSASNGAVQSGPPPTPLQEYGVLVQDNNLYVTNQIIN